MVKGRSRLAISTILAFSAKGGVGLAFPSLTSARSAIDLQRLSFVFSSAKSTCRSLSSTSISDNLSQQTKNVQDALYRIRCVNYMPSNVQQSLLHFQVDGVNLGKVSPSIADTLVNCKMDGNPVFEIIQLEGDLVQPALTLTSFCGTTSEERSSAVAVVMEEMRNRGIVTGWRDELCPVAESFYDEPVFLMERAAVPVLGVLEYGVHINGLVKQQTSSGDKDDVKMWIGRRSATKSKYPGMLDHIAAGGQPAGISLMDNVVKECLEEAGIPEGLTRSGISSVGAISYETYSKKFFTVARNILFCYDLYLPDSFQPAPVDGEVQEFILWTVDEVLESMAKDYADPLKPNCYVVIIDWLIRNGHLSPDVPEYLDVLRSLRSGDCR